MLQMRSVILTPSGPCPYRLLGVDEESVIEWVRKLNEKFAGERYSFEAYRYWIRDSYDVNSDEFRKIAEILDLIMN